MTTGTPQKSFLRLWSLLVISSIPAVFCVCVFSIYMLRFQRGTSSLALAPDTLRPASSLLTVLLTLVNGSPILRAVSSGSLTPPPSPVADPAGFTLKWVQKPAGAQQLCRAYVLAQLITLAHTSGNRLPCWLPFRKQREPPPPT